MFKISILVNLVKSDAQPRDLIDEARAEYNDLQSLVRSYIATGFVAIDSMVYNILMYRNLWLREATIDFEQERETCSATVATLKALGESAGVDVALCTDNAQILLASLTSILEDGFIQCSNFTDNEATVIQNDARYYIDTVMTEVEMLGHQLTVCGKEFLCIEPIVVQILESKASMLQRIGVEFDKAKALGEDLKVLVKQCVDDKKTQMITESKNVVSDATDCVNKLLP